MTERKVQSTIVVVEDVSDIKYHVDFYLALIGDKIDWSKSMITQDIAHLYTKNDLYIRVLPIHRLSRGMKADIVYDMTEPKKELNGLFGPGITVGSPMRRKGWDTRGTG